MTGETLTAGRDVHEISDFDGAAEPAERSARIARLKPYRFQPGRSGNPGGVSTLARRVWQATRDGKDILTFLVDVMRNPKEKTRDRLKAAHELLDRGWGKAPAFLAIQRCEQQQPQRPRLDAGRLTVEQCRTLVHLLNIAYGESVTEL